MPFGRAQPRLARICPICDVLSRGLTMNSGGKTLPADDKIASSGNSTSTLPSYTGLEAEWRLHRSFQ